MEKLIFLVIVLIAVMTPAFAQELILNQMIESADIIAHVKITDVQGGQEEERGVQEWTALCEVIETIKGNVEKNEKIRFRFNRYCWHKVSEPLLVEKDKDYFIFLKGTSGTIKFLSDGQPNKAYNLLDRWVGVFPFDIYLSYRLVENKKD